MIASEGLRISTLLNFLVIQKCPKAANCKEYGNQENEKMMSFQFEKLHEFPWDVIQDIHKKE